MWTTLKFLSYVSTTLLVLGLSACRIGQEEPIREIHIYVVDEQNNPIPNAKVEFYYTLSDFRKGTNRVIEPLYTNTAGVLITALDINVLNYYVNIEKGELNNWYTEQQVELPLFLEHNTDTIVLNSPFEVQLAGRNSKRWIQTYDAINGVVFNPTCSNQLYHDFVYDGSLDKFRSNKCQNEGAPAGFNFWKYNADSNSIYFGAEPFLEKHEIVEKTETTLHLRYQPLPTIVRESKFALVK